MSGKCVTKKDDRKGRGGSPSASRSLVLGKCTGLQRAEQRKRHAKKKMPAPSKLTQLQAKAHSPVSGIQVQFSCHLPPQWGTSVQCTTCTAAVATLMLCRHLGGEDPDFTIEMAQQTPGTLGEDSHVKAHHWEISQPWE